MLTTKVLVASLLLQVATLAGLEYLLYRARLGSTWTVRNVNYYLTARYLPPVLGTVTSLLLKNILQTLRRMLPFIYMADQDKSRLRD